MATLHPKPIFVVAIYLRFCRNFLLQAFRFLCNCEIINIINRSTAQTVKGLLTCRQKMSGSSLFKNWNPSFLTRALSPATFQEHIFKLKSFVGTCSKFVAESILETFGVIVVGAGVAFLFVPLDWPVTDIAIVSNETPKSCCAVIKQKVLFSSPGWNSDQNIENICQD